MENYGSKIPNPKVVYLNPCCVPKSGIVIVITIFTTTTATILNYELLTIIT